MRLSDNDLLHTFAFALRKWLGKGKSRDDAMEGAQAVLKHVKLAKVEFHGPEIDPPRTP